MRLSRALCAVVGEVLCGSHASLDALFISAGAPGEPPPSAHHSKWKEWLFRAGQDPNTDSLVVLGNVLEEFMDLAPEEGSEEHGRWKANRARVEAALEDNGLRYFRFGRVLPQGEAPADPAQSQAKSQTVSKPQTVEELLGILVRGLRRAMHPLTHRRKGSQALSFGSEYDVQDLLHALLRPWISDIRPEEFTPSYAGSSTRMDFLLPSYSLVIETKIIRDRAHARRVGDELIIDIEHYRRHPACKTLWCAIYDPDHLITNADGLCSDLQGQRVTADGSVDVKVLVL
ncbi:MAG: hypothetical protein WD066_01420 [Planctomycetaceae bacterium]